MTGQELYFYAIAEHTLTSADFERLTYDQLIEHGKREYDLLKSYFRDFCPAQVLDALNHFNEKQNDF